MPQTSTPIIAPKKILIVDDDPLIRFGLKKFVTKEGFDAVTASSGHKALEIIEDNEPDIALLDLKLQDSIDGLELLRIIKGSRPQISVIMISGQTEIHGAVEAMKLGAKDYLEKPIDFDHLKKLLSGIREEMITGPNEDESSQESIEITSDKMKKVMAIINRLAVKSDLTILILGESGTGKNYLCKKIHAMSARADNAYVQIGCSNIPDHLIESELFGYEKGAFTDAKGSKKGLIEAAQGGTVLLDELGDMPYQFQSKILKLLEERCFRRIGALQDTPADVRILAATNKDLRSQVQEKKFRLDLFYRINIATIELPALRERPEDIPILAKNFLTTFCLKYNAPLKNLTPGAMQKMLEYNWPGNVRQLKNLIEKLVVLSDGEEINSLDITDNLEDCQPAPHEEHASTNSSLPEDLSLEAMEERFIQEALKKSGGNQRKAAKLLNISRDALRYRLKKMNLSTSDIEDD